MNKPTIANYLNQESKTLGSMLAKLKQLNQWNAWLAECLGDEKLLIDHCLIVNLDGTSLIVIADNSHWVMRFRFHVPTLVTKLRNYPDFRGIKSICCKVRPPHYSATGKKTGKKLVLSDDNAKMLREAAGKITDEKLRQVMEKIAGYTNRED